MKDLEDNFLKSGMRILRHIHNSGEDDVTIYANSTHLQEERLSQLGIYLIIMKISMLVCCC